VEEAELGAIWETLRSRSEDDDSTEAGADGDGDGDGIELKGHKRLDQLAGILREQLKETRNPEAVKRMLSDAAVSADTCCRKDTFFDALDEVGLRSYLSSTECRLLHCAFSAATPTGAAAISRRSSTESVGHVAAKAGAVTGTLTTPRSGSAQKPPLSARGGGVGGARRAAVGGFIRALDFLKWINADATPLGCRNSGVLAPHLNISMSHSFISTSAPSKQTNIVLATPPHSRVKPEATAISKVAVAAVPSVPLPLAKSTANASAADAAIAINLSPVVSSSSTAVTKNASTHQSLSSADISQPVQGASKIALAAHVQHKDGSHDLEDANKGPSTKGDETGNIKGSGQFAAPVPVPVPAADSSTGRGGSDTDSAADDSSERESASPPVVYEARNLLFNTVIVSGDTLKHASLHDIIVELVIGGRAYATSSGLSKERGAAERSFAVAWNYIPVSAAAFQSESATLTLRGELRNHMSSRPSMDRSFSTASTTSTIGSASNPIHDPPKSISAIVPLRKFFVAVDDPLHVQAELTDSVSGITCGIRVALQGTARENAENREDRIRKMTVENLASMKFVPLENDDDDDDDSSNDGDEDKDILDMLFAGAGSPSKEEVSSNTGTVSAKGKVSSSSKKDSGSKFSMDRKRQASGLRGKALIASMLSGCEDSESNDDRDGDSSGTMLSPTSKAKQASFHKPVGRASSKRTLLQSQPQALALTQSHATKDTQQAGITAADVNNNLSKKAATISIGHPTTPITAAVQPLASPDYTVSNSPNSPAGYNHDSDFEDRAKMSNTTTENKTATDAAAELVREAESEIAVGASADDDLVFGYSVMAQLVNLSELEAFDISDDDDDDDNDDDDNEDKEEEDEDG
jgi:hypothetical protein